MLLSMLDTSIIQKAFNQAAGTYSASAVLAKESAQALVERLQYFAIKPKVILDVGSGTGFVAQALKASPFSKAYTIALDFASAMLQGQNAICADTLKLPIKTASVDLLVSNLCLPFVNDLGLVFKEWQRVLKPGAACVFSTLGPDTLIELREAFARVHNQPHVHGFYDMHDVGDALLKANFAEPVMDVDNVSLPYQSLKDLFDDLKRQGVTNALDVRLRGLMTPRLFNQCQLAYPKTDGYYHANVEVVFGSAWATDVVPNKRVGEAVHVPLDSLFRKR